jgi:hypothetical protein
MDKQLSKVLQMPKVKKKRCLVVEPSGAPCKRRHVAKGYCSLHYQRAMPKPDGTLPTVEEIAGVAEKTVRRHHIGGRVDEETFARLQRGVAMGLGTCMYDLVSKIAAEFDPEAAMKRRRGAA